MWIMASKMGRSINFFRAAKKNKDPTAGCLFPKKNIFSSWWLKRPVLKNMRKSELDHTQKKANFVLKKNCLKPPKLVFVHAGKFQTSKGKGNS